MTPWWLCPETTSAWSCTSCSTTSSPSTSRTNSSSSPWRSWPMATVERERTPAAPASGPLGRPGAASCSPALPPPVPACSRRPGLASLRFPFASIPSFPLHAPLSAAKILFPVSHSVLLSRLLQVSLFSPSQACLSRPPWPLPLPLLVLRPSLLPPLPASLVLSPPSPASSSLF